MTYFESNKVINYVSKPHRFFKLKSLSEVGGGVVDPDLARGEALKETSVVGEHRPHGFEAGSLLRIQ